MEARAAARRADLIERIMVNIEFYGFIIEDEM
jgi:hypothetical protein